MKPGELVRVDYPKNDRHNQLGIVVNVDKSMKTWPGDRIYCDVMMGNGEVLWGNDIQKFLISNFCEKIQ